MILEPDWCEEWCTTSKLVSRELSGRPFLFLKWCTTLLFLSISDSFTKGYGLLLFINGNFMLVLSPIFGWIHDTLRTYPRVPPRLNNSIHVSQSEPYVCLPISKQFQILALDRTFSNLWWSCSDAKPPIALFSLRTSHIDSLKYKEKIENWMTIWEWLYQFNMVPIQLRGPPENGRYEKGCLFWVFSGRKWSGLNSSASSPQISFLYRHIK